MLEAIEIGKDKIRLSHLQYADDTLFLYPSKMRNIKTIKYILQNVELLSVLGVNFNKCSMWGYNIDLPTLNEMAGALGCVIGDETIGYLGITMGINHRRSDFVGKLG